MMKAMPPRLTMIRDRIGIAKLSISVLLAAQVVLAGCRRDTSDQAGQSGRILHIASVEPTTLDPNKLTGGPARKIASNLFTGLTTLSGSGEVRPGCAAKWTHSEDRRFWTFELRPSLSWSDGIPVTAQSFVDSWKRAIDPSTGNPNIEMFDVLVDAAEQRNARSATILRVRAETATRLTIHTTRPTPDLPRRLAGIWAAPVPLHTIKEYGSQWTKPKYIVTNGPYILDTYIPSVSMTFRRNTSSFQPSSIDRVMVRFTDNPVDAMRWFELGTIDWSDNLVPRDEIRTLRAKTQSPLKTTPYLGLTYIIPNISRTSIDLPLRRALNLATDRMRIIKHVLDGSQRPLSRPIPRSLLGSAPGPAFNPQLARRILGSSSTLRSRPLQLAFYNGGRNSEIAAFLQREWSEHLGLEITLQGMEWKSFLSSTATGEFDLAIFTLGGYDAADLLSVFSSESPNNRGGYRSGVVDRHLRAAKLATSDAEHQKLLAKVESELVEDVAVISLCQLTRHALVRNSFTGWRPNIEDHHPWDALRWAKN